jgi:hypothetical protein
LLFVLIEIHAFTALACVSAGGDLKWSVSSQGGWGTAVGCGCNDADACGAADIVAAIDTAASGLLLPVPCASLLWLLP